jgi:hypothetical protein
MLDTLRECVGRVGVYAEGDLCCLVRVESVGDADGEMSATLVREPGTPACRRRLVCLPGDDEVISWDVEDQIPARWQVGKALDHFYLHDWGYWDGSLYCGFRVVFHPYAVERFLRRELFSIDECYRGAGQAGNGDNVN